MGNMVSGLESHLGYWLRLVSNAVSASFRRKLEARGVSVAEWVVLRTLLDGAASPSGMADGMGMTRGAVTKIVDKLAERGLVERTEREEDRRRREVRLTGAGRKLAPALARDADGNDEAFFGHLSAQERAGAEALLRGLVERHRIRGAAVE